MSATSASSPSSPIQHRDIRSASKPFKRDRDHSQKWSNGERPSHGVSVRYTLGMQGGEEEERVGGNERQLEKVRPQKQWSLSNAKTHANLSPKPTPTHGHGYGVTSNVSTGRVFRKMDATMEANDASPLSRSLLDLLPTHANNTDSPIQTAMRTSDADIFYSFDNKGKSPGQNSRPVDLGGLVEQAEKKFLAEQTEKIVKGEYEVIDGQGEIAVLGKKGKKGSPKQRAVKTETSIVATKLDDDDDDFELV